MSGFWHCTVQRICNSSIVGGILVVFSFPPYIVYENLCISVGYLHRSRCGSESGLDQEETPNCLQAGVCKEFCLPQILANTWCCPLVVAILVRSWSSLIVVLICISLVNKAVAHHFICVLDIWIFHFCEAPVQNFCPFLFLFLVLPIFFLSFLFFWISVFFLTDL